MARVAEEISRNAARAALLSSQQPVTILVPASRQPTRKKPAKRATELSLEREVEKIFRQKYGWGRVKKSTGKRNKIRRKLARKRGVIRPGTKVQYTEYIKSSQWKNKRKEFISLHGSGRCELCHSKDNLVVHHHTYQRVGVEKFDDLALLCSACHHRVHFLEDGTKTPLRASVLRERFRYLLSGSKLNV